jgi:hypothetical protein
LALQSEIARTSLLPPPELRVLLLTYDGETRRTRSDATTRDLPRTINLPYTPLTVAPHNPQSLHWGRISSAVSNRLSKLPAITIAAFAAATTLAQHSARCLRRGLFHFVKLSGLTYSIDPGVVAKIGLTGVTIGAVVLLARVSPVKPQDVIVGRDAASSPQIVAQTTQPATHPHRRSNFATTTRANRTVAADIRIVDAPVRMKQGCNEQTWPYIADYCLTVGPDAEPAPSSNAVIAEARTEPGTEAKTEAKTPSASSVVAETTPTPADPVVASVTPPDSMAAGDSIHTMAAQAPEEPTAPAIDAAASQSSGNTIAQKNTLQTVVSDAGDDLAGQKSYRTAALADRVQTSRQGETSGRAHRISISERHDEPRRHYVQLRHAERRHTARRYDARLRPWPERRFAEGRSYGAEDNTSHAPWY